MDKFALGLGRFNFSSCLCFGVQLMKKLNHMFNYYLSYWLGLFREKNSIMVSDRVSIYVHLFPMLPVTIVGCWLKAYDMWMIMKVCDVDLFDQFEYAYVEILYEWRDYEWWLSLSKIFSFSSIYESIWYVNLLWT